MYMQELISDGVADEGEVWNADFTSYVGCFGSYAVTALPSPTNCKVDPRTAAQANGCFTDVSPIRLASITDGPSNTMFVAERATTTLRVWTDRIYTRYGWYFTGNMGDTLFTTFYPPNVFKKVDYPLPWAASSLHPGGLNALMGDGSVRFIKETVQTWPYDPETGLPVGAVFNRPGGWWSNTPPPGVWQALATRAGGEVSNADAF